MNSLQNCIDYLDRNQITFSHSVHSPAYTARGVASAERIPAHNLAKTVVYAGDNGYGMVVLPADCVVNFAEITRLMGITKVRLATEAELADLFPQSELGAMPPLRHIVDMPILVDEGVAAEPFIAFTAGTHRDVIHMSFEDYRRLENPLIAAFAIKEHLVGAV